MRSLPQVFSQRDPKRSAQRLGTVNGSTIGSDGCYITSFAMLACYYGHNITPEALDDLFTNNHWYWNAAGNHNDPADMLADQDLSKAFADVTYVKTYDYTSVPADLNNLKNLLADPSVSVIIEVDFNHNPGDGIQTHFIVAVDCDGSNVTVADPWYGSVDAFNKNYGNNPSQTILKYVVYKGNPVGAGTSVDAATFAKLVHNSGVTDSLNDYVKLPHNSDWDAIKAKLALADDYQNLKSDRDSQAGRASKWDQLCLRFGITSDSNQASVDDLYNAASAKFIPTIQANPEPSAPTESPALTEQSTSSKVETSTESPVATGDTSTNTLTPPDPTFLEQVKNALLWLFR